MSDARLYSLLKPIRAMYVGTSELTIEDIPAGAIVRATGRRTVGGLVEVRWGGAIFGVVEDDLGDAAQEEVRN